MKLHYDRNQNVGDELNAWLWPRLIPEVLDDDERAMFLGIGSLLNSNLPADPFKVVFGTGVALNPRGVEYGKRLPRLDARWKIYCVRGPLSARALGLPAELAVTDAAALLHLVDLPAEPKLHPVSFIPHCLSATRWPWRALCAQAGVHFINPNDPVETVLRDLRRSKVVIAEAMHGAIMADALRVPWIPAKAYANILAFKWQDWCQSLGLTYSPVSLPSLYTPESIAGRVGSYLRRLRLGGGPAAALYLRAVTASVRAAAGDHTARLAEQTAAHLSTLAERTPWTLSADDVFARAVARLAERLELLHADHASGRLEALIGAARPGHPTSTPLAIA